MHEQKEKALLTDHQPDIGAVPRPTGQTFLRATALAAVLALGLSTAASAGAASAALAAKAPAAAALLSQAEQGGKVRVIVRLAERTSAAESDTSETADAARIASAGTAIDSFVSRFFGRGGESSGTNLTRMRYQPLVAFDATAADLERLASDRDVVSVVEDRLSLPTLYQSVPLIGMPKVWQEPAGRGDNSVVAILDTGADLDHPFFAKRIIGQACFSSTTSISKGFCPNGKNSQVGKPSGQNCPYPQFAACSHGTHVTGITAGYRPSGIPDAGVAPRAGIYVVQVFSHFFNLPKSPVRSQSSDQILALEHLYGQRDKMPGGRKLASINMSLGGGKFPEPCPDDALRPIIRMLKNAGVATVIASGNDGYRNAASSPSCIPEAVTVGSTDKDDKISWFSNSASYVDVLAPGGEILSSWPGGLYKRDSGTSMATPHVAGAIAALKSITPTASVDALVANLAETGKPIEDTRTNGKYTKPRIQVNKAVVPPLLSVGPKTSYVIERKPNGGSVPAKITLRVRTDRSRVAWRLVGVPSWLEVSAKRGTASTTPEAVEVKAKPPARYARVLSARLRFEPLSDKGPTVTVTVKLKPLKGEESWSASALTVTDGADWRGTWAGGAQ